MVQQEVTVATRGFNDPVVLPVFDVSASWNVADAGSLSCLVHRDDAANLPWDTVLDRWVYWRSPAGLWGGSVHDITYHLATRYVEWGCRSFHDLLADRRTDQADLDAMTAGGIVSRALTTVQNADPVPIDTYAIEETGEPFAFQLRGDDVMSVVNSVAGQVGYEWRISLQDDLSVLFEFRQHLGRNLAHQVVVREGVHFADADLTLTTTGMVNDLLAVSNNDDFANATAQVALNYSSIQQYRRRQATKTYDNLVAGSALYAAAKADVRKTAFPQVSLRATLDNVDNIYDQFVEGDTITVVSDTANTSLAMRVMSRSLTSDLQLEIAATAALPSTGL